MIRVNDKNAARIINGGRLGPMEASECNCADEERGSGDLAYLCIVIVRDKNVLRCVDA